MKIIFLVSVKKKLMVTEFPNFTTAYDESTIIKNYVKTQVFKSLE